MPTMHPSPEPRVPEKISSQESPLSPEWTHAITILMGHPLSSEPGKHIKNWIIYHRIHKYTMFALKWNPTQFKLDIHLQMYQETDGSLAYLKGHTVRKLVSLMKYMSLLIRQDRPDAQKHNPLYFISGNQLFKLTAHDMKSALVNEKLENHGSQKYYSKRVKVINPKPTNTLIKVPTAIQISGNNPNDNIITVPTIIQTSIIKKGMKPVDPPQNVATSHLENPISTTTNLDEACPLDTSCDHLLHLDLPSLSPELQYNSSVDSDEIMFLPESEGQLDHTKHSPTDLFSEHHDYELFLLQKEFDAPNDNPNHYDIHTCENQDDILIHATYLSNIFALPQFMAQHTCEDQEPTDEPIAVPTASQASCDHTLKPKCAHNPIDIPVQWFKFIHPIHKPRMTKTPFQIAVHKAYSPIASMNYKWTINLHDGYPLFQVMKQEGYITPSLHIPKHDLSSLAPPKGEMKSSLSWTSSTLCFGEPTLGKLNQVKLLCSISSRTLWDPMLAKSNQETELCITKHIPLCESAGHTEIPFPIPRSSSETNRVSNNHSSLVTTPISRMILGKLKIEVTKVLTHNSGKNGKHFYWENWHNTTKNGENSECSSILVTKNLMHHAGRNGEHHCVPFNLNNTSCGFMLKEVDWGGKHPMNSLVDWHRHETYPTGHNISEVDRGALHDSSFFLFLVNIDYDAKPKDFLPQELCRGLPERTSSTTLRSLNYIKGKWVHPLELQKGPSRLNHQLDQQRDPTSSPYPQHESSYNLLNQWDPGEKSLLPQLFRKATASKIIYFLWIQSEYNLSCMLSKHWEFLKILQVIQNLLKATASKIIYFLWIQSEYNLSCMLSKH